MRSVRQLDADIRRTVDRLRSLRSQRMQAKIAEREKQRVDVRAAYERGDDRTRILRRFQVTDGQLAGWALRSGWVRPVDLVKTLSTEEHGRYRRLRAEMGNKSAAVRAARQVQA